MNAETISNILNGKPKAGGCFMACCPAHDDRTPSLSIKDGDNGKPLVNCLAGCSQDAVIDALKQRGAWYDTTTTLSPAECQAMKKKAEKAKAERLKAEVIKHARAERNAKTFLENATKDPSQHPYTIKKGLPLGGGIKRGPWVKRYQDEASGEWMEEVWDDCLLFPIYSSDKKLVSVQAIRVLTPEQKANDEKDKDFLAGGRTKGCFHPIGKISSASGFLVIGEGWATVAAVCKVMGCPGVVAMYAGNLEPVAREIKKLAPSAEICIIADDDQKEAV